MQPDFDRSAAAMVAGTQKAIKAALEPVLRRLEALEARPLPERGEPGQQGERGIGIAAADKRDGVLILRLTDDSELNVGNVDGVDGEPGQDGVSPDPEAIAATFRETAVQIVSEAVAAGLASLPPPEKGEKGDQGLPGAAGADGRGWAKSFIDRDGNLIATFSDGSSDNLGPVVGKDGKDGEPGFGLDDFDMTPTQDLRVIEMKFQRGDTAHTFEWELPIPLYQGVFKEGLVYSRGDIVTWGGSMWHSNKSENTSKPDTDGDWTLCTKKGRDGKDAKV